MRAGFVITGRELIGPGGACVAGPGNGAVTGVGSWAGDVQCPQDDVVIGKLGRDSQMQVVSGYAGIKRLHHLPRRAAVLAAKETCALGGCVAAVKRDQIIRTPAEREQRAVSSERR